MTWNVPQLMTADEVSERLLVSRQGLDRLRRAGRIKAVLVGRNYRYAPEDVREFIDQQRNQSKEATP